MKIYRASLHLGGILVVSTALLSGWAGAQTVRTADSAATTATPLKAVSKVEVARSGQQTIVQVSTHGGSGDVAYRTERLDNPPRIVLDVDSAHLAAAPVVESKYEPVRAVRLSQYQPGKVRIVVDLQRKMGFYIEQQGQSLAINLLDADGAVAAPQSVSAKTSPAQVSSFALPNNLTSSAQALASPQQASAPVAATPSSVTMVAQAGPAPAARPAQGPAPGGAQAQRYTGEPISVDLRDVDLRDFFRLIHEISGLNVVLDPSVKGTVTLVLDSVPWDQALDIVMRNNGLTNQLDGNVLRIATQGTMKKEAEDRQALAKAEADAVPTVTTTRVLSYAKATEVSATLRRFLSARGDIFFDDRSNTLIIRDIPDALPQLDNLIRQLDRKAQQVEIEARVVLASRNFARDIGTQLAFAGRNPSGKSVAGGDSTVGTSTVTRTPPPPLIVGDPTSAKSGAMPFVTDLAAVAPTSGMSYLLSSTNFALDYMITAAESKGVGKLLSSPHLVAQNNAKATVMQGTKVPIQTSINNTVSVQYINAVLQLAVTPQITADGTVFMDVLVENTTIDAGIPRINGTPALDTQSAETKTTIADGGTVVIGGVMVSNQSTTIQQVPLVGSVPLIGHLFKRTAVNVNTQELLFFITPRVQPG
jgi:type IV pilus secretin PilQ/predicted competence protein